MQNYMYLEDDKVGYTNDEQYYWFLQEKFNNSNIWQLGACNQYKTYANNTP